MTDLNPDPLIPCKVLYMYKPSYLAPIFEPIWSSHSSPLNVLCLRRLHPRAFFSGKSKPVRFRCWQVTKCYGIGEIMTDHNRTRPPESLFKSFTCTAKLSGAGFQTGLKSQICILKTKGIEC